MSRTQPSKTKEQLRAMYLAGTVSLPPRFPDIAEISFSSDDSTRGPIFITATERLSPKVMIKRTFFAQDVMSLFLPNDVSQVDFKSGTWFEGEVLAAKGYDSLDRAPLRGIIYVRENAQSILEMEAGLTAAESAQYYPPLPEDRSVDHYCMQSNDAAARCW